MEAYKTPESNLEIKGVDDFKPIKGLLLGLGISVVIVSLMSSVIGMVAVSINGMDITSVEAYDILAHSIPYLILDLIMSALVVFYAGRVVGKRTPGKAIKFGLILSLIVSVTYLILFLLVDSIELYPVWYNVLTFVSVLLFIPLGAKSTVKNN